MWKSNAMANYGNGYIFACAENIDFARLIAQTKIYESAKKKYCWFPANIRDLDSDDYELFLIFEEKFKKDISKDPETGIFFAIEGSE